jgi:hypothetical protein
MGDAGAEGTVRRFFEETLVAGLLLPDGWFGGRPMENHHRLTFVVARPKRLLLELDEHLLLSLSGMPLVERTGSALEGSDGASTLVISGYQQCVLDYVEYANETPHAVVYTEGRICLVGPS